MSWCTVASERHLTSSAEESVAHTISMLDMSGDRSQNHTVTRKRRIAILESEDEEDTESVESNKVGSVATPLRSSTDLSQAEVGKKKKKKNKFFRLMDLPPELRNRIYTHAIHNHGPIKLQQHEELKELARPTGLRKIPFLAIPAILSVSRQTRFETIGLLISEGHFVLVMGLDDWSVTDRVNSAIAQSLEGTIMLLPRLYSDWVVDPAEISRLEIRVVFGGYGRHKYAGWHAPRVIDVCEAMRAVVPTVELGVEQEAISFTAVGYGEEVLDVEAFMELVFRREREVLAQGCVCTIPSKRSAMVEVGGRAVICHNCIRVPAERLQREAVDLGYITEADAVKAFR